MNRMQAAALLGVEVTAGPAEVKKAYTSRARLLHPDRFAGASDADAAAATSAMAQLNEAYEVLSSQGASSGSGSARAAQILECFDCGKRNRVPESARAANCANCGAALFLPWVSTASGDEDFGFPLWRDPSTACDLCGWGPAQEVSYRYVTGLILWWQWSTFEGLVCSECNRTVFHENQAWTFTRGWWGIFAPFVSLVAIVMNWVTYRDSRGIPEPQGKCWEKLSLSPIPLFNARPFWKRPLALISTGVAVLIVAFIIAAFIEAQPPARSADGSLLEPGNASVFQLRPGDCIRGAISGEVSSTELVPCSSPHVHEVFWNTTIQLGAYSSETASQVAEQRCMTRFAAYVGIPFDQSRFYISALFPTAQGWSRGDRRVTCLLSNEAESPEVGSARNSRQ